MYISYFKILIHFLWLWLITVAHQHLPCMCCLLWVGGMLLSIMLFSERCAHILLWKWRKLQSTDDCKGAEGVFYWFLRLRVSTIFWHNFSVQAPWLAKIP
jgi:hypothetical protein